MVCSLLFPVVTIFYINSEFGTAYSVARFGRKISVIIAPYKSDMRVFSCKNSFFH